MTGWSSKPEWPEPTDASYANAQLNKAGIKTDLWALNWTKPKFIGVDLGKDDKTVVVEGEFAKGILKVTDIREATEDDIKAATDAANFGVGHMQDGKHVPLEKVYNNLSPTHDPYTNPNAQLYYECKCGAILDPGTKSFAGLNNAASDKGWKVRWKANGEGYEPFCEECGKDVE